MTETGTSGFDIWTTDGTAIGTRRVVDLDNSQTKDTSKPKRLELAPRELTPIGDYLYFSAHTKQGGRELWRMGSTESAEMVEDLVPGESGSHPTGLGETANGLAYFAIDPAAGDQQVTLRVITSSSPELELPELLIASSG